MIKFDSKNRSHKTPFGADEINTDISFTILVSKRIGAMNVNIVFEGEQRFSLPLSFCGLNGIYEEYTGVLSINKKGLYFYHFEIEDYLKRIVKIGKDGFDKAVICYDYKPWKLTVYNNTFKSLKTYYGKNIYQIFPDRFCKAGELNTEKHDNIKTWGDIPNHIREADGTLDTSDFFGGNFKGIESKLKYLYSLGVGIIYMNPIFEASSNHRYDTGDYEKPDTLLGTIEEFTELCSEADKYGIRIILDGVFSHTGSDSKYFNKDNNYDSIGAYQSQQSEYYRWYKFNSWPDDYKCWWNVKILPETNEEEDSFLDYITGENGVARKWIRAGASGWRLDVADELPDLFLERFRNAVKTEKDDALIIGEVWENAADKISYDQRRRYLHGNQIDSVMNYVFRNAVIDFMNNGDSYTFKNTVLEICEDYPSPVLNVLMNFLGTHDTERIKTILGSREKVCLAYALLAFLPGLPTIYYGDEAGMEGGRDPLNRLCYPWDNEDIETVSFFKRVNELRNNLDCLKDGAFVPVYYQNGILAFRRESEQGSCLFIINNSDKKVQLEFLSDKSIDLFSNTEYHPYDYLSEHSFIVLND